MPLAAAGSGHLRASHADRERVIDVLKTAFVQGRLAKDEFEARIGQTFVSRTYADLAYVTADLTEAPPVRKPARSQVEKAASDPARRRAKKAAAWGAYGIVLPALFAVAIVPGPITVRAAITTSAVIYLIFWVCGVSMMVAGRPPKRSRGQLPPA
jgi:lysozyme family protein